MTRLRKSLFSLLALPLLLSCDDSQNKVFDNPLDQEGVNYSPPSLVMQTPTREAPTHRTVSLDVIGRGSGRGDTVMMAYFHNLELNRFDSVGFKPGDSVATDTFTLTTGLNTPKVIKVAVMVRNSRGVFSTTADTFRLAMRTILPTLQVVKADTMVDLWDTASVVARGQDSGGTIAKYHWTVDGVESTTADSVIRLPVGHSIRTVTVVAENDVGLRSASKLVRLASQGHPPQVTSLSVPDTAEFSMPFTVKAKASDAGGSIARMSWRLFQGTDTAFKSEAFDSVLTIPGSVVAAIKAGRWTLRAIATDNDTLTGSADTSLVIAARGPVLVPAARKILRVGVLDTFSLRFAATERIDSAARAPITINVIRDTSPVYSLANMAWLKDSLTKAGTVYYRYWAEDNLHLRSATDTIQVVASDRMPTLTSPAKGQQASDTAVLFAWTPGYYDSFFVLIADTSADKILTNNGADAMIRRRVDSSSLRVVFPFNTRIHWRILGFARGRSDSASSESFSFNTPPDAQSDPYLSALAVAGRSLTPSYSVQDSVYTVNIDPSVKSLNLTFTKKTGQSIEVSSEAVAATVLSSSPYIWNFAGLNDTLKLKVTSANGKVRRILRIGINSVIDPNYLLDSLLVDGVPLAGFSTMGGTFTVPFVTGTLSVAIRGVPHLATATVSPQKSIWLYSDDTAKTMYVTANGQSYTIKYRLVPYKVKSKVDMVKDLGYVVPSSPATMPFATNDTGRTYTTSVGFSDSVLTLQWTRAVTSQKVIVNETELTGVNSTKIPLGLGVTEVKMKVIADDTNFVRNFSLFITRNRSSEARLATLTDTVKTDTLSPAFHSDSLAYRLSTTFGADTARLAFTTKSTLVKSVSVSGGVLEGNTLKIPLKAFGDTAKASITILAADSLTTKTYSIAARTRTAEQVAVLSGLNYALSTAAGMSSWTLATDSVLKVTGAFKDTGFAFTATRQGSLATMTLNGVAITSGVKTGYFPLVAGDTNTFKLVVTAQDTAVKKNYYLKVFRTAGLKVANLSALSLTNGTSALGLDTAFKAADSVYVVNAPFTDTAVVVTPTGPISAFKSIAVNGVEVTSGTASGKVLLTKIGDTNLVSIVVTAQDTTVKQTYLVKVFRAAASKVAGLSGLVVSNGASNLALDTAFKTADTVYVTSAAFVDTAVVVTPTGPISAFKSIAVNGVEVTSGTASGKVLLTKIGDTNSVSIVVTAQDTTVKQTYVVKVFRAAASKVAGLSGLVVTKGATTLALDSAFKTADTVYVTSVAFADTAVTVTPTKSVAVIKSITVNGTDVASATASGKILLTKIADTNVVSIVVTAQDTSVKQTYVVKVYRAAPSKNAWLKRIGASAGTLSPVFDTATSAYTLNVDNGVTDVTFAPMANDSVYGTVVVTGAPTNLVVGTAQVATLTVKAQDTTAKKVYTVSVIRSRGDSTLPSSFSTDTTLTLANSPYLVGAASFTVPLGKTLRIEPGVRIKVPVTTVGGTAVPKAFLVKGSLLARGTVAQPIVFTKASVTNWGYLLIDSTSDDATFDGTGAYTGGSILENVVVEYAGASPGAPGGLRISAASPYLHNVTVQGSSTVGVQLVNSDNQTMQAEGVVVQDNGGDGWNGVDIDWNDGSKFTNCVAQRNGGVGFNYVGMAVTMKYCSSLQNGGHGFYGVQGGDVVGLIAQGNNGWGTNNVSGKFDSCRILGNQGGGFHMGAPLYQEVTLINSEIRNNAGGYALYLHSSGVIGSYIRCDVRNNVIAGNSASHTIYYYAQRDGSIFHDNVVQDNVATATDYGSYIFGVYDNTTTSNAFSMKNNVFRNNRAPQYVIQTTDWGGNLAQIVQGNIFVGNQSTTGPVFKIGGNLNGPQIFDGNRLDSNVALTGAVIEIGGYSTNQVNFTNNAVRANRVSTGVTGSVFKINGYSSTGGKVVFAGNNFAGHKWDGVNWFLMQMEHPATGIGATATGNYWGQADSDPNMFLDATLDPSRAAIDYTGALSVPSPTAPALP